MIFILGIAVIVLAVTAHFLGPKEFWKKESIDLLMNRTTMAFLLTLSIVGLSLIYVSFYPFGILPLWFELILDMIFFIPFFIPYAIGYSEGELLFYTALMTEILIVTMIVRLMISKRWVEKMKQKMKNVAQHRL